jgi:WD40 repeat protein
MGAFWDPVDLDAVVQQESVAALLDQFDKGVVRDHGPAAQVLREAVAMSAGVLVEDPAQMPAQLVGRLAGQTTPEIRTFVERTRAFVGRTWLCPQTATLTGPGAPLRRILRGTPDFVTAVAVSADARFAVSGSYRRDVRVWDLDRGLPLARFVGERAGSSYPEGAGGDAITAVVLVGDSVLAASADRCVYLIDRVTGKGEMVVRGETDNLFAVALSADGGTMVAGPKDLWGGVDFRVQVWDVRSRQLTRRLDGEGYPIEHVVVSPGGDLAVAASRAGALTIWDTATGVVRWTGSDAAVTAMALSTDGSLLATGHESGQILVRRSGADEPAHRLVAGGGTVGALAFVDAHRLVGGIRDGTVFVRDLVAGEGIDRLPAQGSPVFAVAGCPDLGVLVSGFADGAMRCWDVRAPRTEPVPPSQTATVTPPEDGSVRQRVEELETKHFGGDASSQHEVIAVAASGRLALAASRHWTLIYFRLGIAREETHIRVWDTKAGTLVRDLAVAARDLEHGGHVDTYRCVALSDDGGLAAAGSDDRTLRVWDVGTGEQVAAFTGESAITGCGISQDGSRVVATEASGREHTLDLRCAPAAASSDHLPWALRLFPAVRERRDPEDEQVERRRPVVALGRKATARTIEKYLERYGLEATRLSGTEQEDQTYVSALGVESHGYQVTIRHDVGLGQLEFRIAGLLHATLDDTPADRIHGLLLALSVLNYRIPLGALGYDPTDGEVALRYTLPVTGDEVRYEDFEQVLVVLQNVVAKHAADLRAVVAGERTAREILR